MGWAGRDSDGGVDGSGTTCSAGAGGSDVGGDVGIGAGVGVAVGVAVGVGVAVATVRFGAVVGVGTGAAAESRIVPSRSTPVVTARWCPEPVVPGLRGAVAFRNMPFHHPVRGSGEAGHPARGASIAWPPKAHNGTELGADRGWNALAIRQLCG